MIVGMCLGKRTIQICALLALALNASGQVIEFESNGLKYQALTRNGLTIMLALLPAQVKDFTVLQVAVSNGGSNPQMVRPEDFRFVRDDGTETPALPARTVVFSLMDKASRGD